MALDKSLTDGAASSAGTGTTFQDIWQDAMIRLGLKHDDTTTEGTALINSVKAYVNDNYKWLANKYDWKWLYEKDTIVTTARYNTGTVTVTEGSATVTGSGTTFTSAMEGRKFKVTGFEEIYTIESVDSTTQLTLDNEYNGDDDDEASYDIFEDEYSLPSDCDHIVSLVQHRHPIKLNLISLRELRRKIPAPDLTDTDPTHYAYYEPDSSGNQQIILWPPPYRQIVLNMDYKLLITEMVSDSSTPLIPEQYRQILKLMTMADLYGHEKDDDRTTYFEQKVNRMITEMMGKYAQTDDQRRFIPENKRRKNYSLQSLANRYDLGDYFDRY
jgi:hypothetical protein